MPTETEIEAAAPAACPWCGTVLGPDCDRPPGRIRCGSCGVATTCPGPPTPSSRRRTAAVPAGSRPLRRARRPRAQRRCGPRWPSGSTARAARPGARCRCRRRHAGAALRGRGRDALGLERHARDDVLGRRTRRPDGEWAAIVFWHSLEHLREPGDASRACRAAARAGRAARDRAAQCRKPAGRAVRRPLARPRPAATSGARARRRAWSRGCGRSACSSRGSATCAAVRSGSAGPRPGRPAARPPGPLRRDPLAGGAHRPMSRGADGRCALLAGACAAPGRRRRDARRGRRPSRRLGVRRGTAMTEAA